MHQSRYIPPLEYILIRNVRFVCFNIGVGTAHRNRCTYVSYILLLFLFVWLLGHEHWTVWQCLGSYFLEKGVQKEENESKYGGIDGDLRRKTRKGKRTTTK